MTLDVDLHEAERHLWSFSVNVIEPARADLHEPAPVACQFVLLLDCGAAVVHPLHRQAS